MFRNQIADMERERKRKKEKKKLRRPGCSFALAWI